MADFEINKQNTLSQSSRLTEVGGTVKSVKSMVSNANSGLVGIGLGGVVPSLVAIEARLAKHAAKLDSMSAALNQIVLKYVAAESDIMGIPLFMNPDFYEIIANGVSNGINSLIGSIANPIFNIVPGVPFTIGGIGSAGIDFIGDILHFPESVGLDIMPVDLDLLGTSDWTDLFDMDNPFFDQADTLHMVEFGPSVEGSVWDISGVLDGPYGSLTGNVSALTGEAHATAWGGLFDAEGNFAPGIGAELGVSGSLFEAGFDGTLGNQYLGLYAEGGVEVGHAEATLGISAGLYDGDGNFNPSLGGGASAEVVVAQASGSAGATVMGTDVGVSGSIGFGAGAHANVGLQDGVFSLDLGAYVGVGGSVGITIDFNDTYDTIVDAWDATCDWASDTWDAATDWASDTWDTATDWASDTWDTATDWASDAWDTATSWWPF